jgi:hypothetical protein
MRLFFICFMLVIIQFTLCDIKRSAAASNNDEAVDTSHNTQSTPLDIPTFIMDSNGVSLR